MPFWIFEQRQAYTLIYPREPFVLTPELSLELVQAVHDLDPTRATHDLLDLSGCTISPEISFNSISSMVIEMQRREIGKRPWHKLAIVVKSNVGFGLARTYQAVSSEVNRETKVFYDRQAAIAWLEE